MNTKKTTAIVISASSDIGAAMCKRWLACGHEVLGTYRTHSPAVDELAALGVRLFACDLGDAASVRKACDGIAAVCDAWDVLVLAPGAQEPVGIFLDCDFDEWGHSVNVNFLNQLAIAHRLLPLRNQANPLGAMTLFFAGGGTNTPVPYYSAYTISKIALIKMCELLDAEIADARFSIVGPGWVKTKIHNATLTAGPDRAGGNFERTRQQLSSDKCTPMEQVLDSCDWIIGQAKDVVSGRNFSTVFDQWGTEELAQTLRANVDMYKLRRYGNELMVNKR